jgi:hypothetical protein
LGLCQYSAQRERCRPSTAPYKGRGTMNSIIYLVGLIVIVLAILSLVGLA